MQQVIDFLRELSVNNNRDWFEAHKPRYRVVQAIINDLAAGMIDGVAAFDPSIRGLEVKDVTYRIYRDTRFSNDKTPYKNHIGIYVCPGGKKSMNAGYYFHIEPSGNGMMGGYFLTSGLYMPEPAVLRSVREEIADESNVFMDAVKKAKGFTLNMGNSLKRVPQGFEAGHPMEAYLKLKDVYVEKQVDEDYILDPGLLDNVVADFKKTYAFNSLLNRCAEYAREEM